MCVCVGSFKENFFADTFYHWAHKHTSNFSFDSFFSLTHCRCACVLFLYLNRQWLAQFNHNKLHIWYSVHIHFTAAPLRRIHTHTHGWPTGKKQIETMTNEIKTAFPLFGKYDDVHMNAVYLKQLNLISDGNEDVRSKGNKSCFDVQNERPLNRQKIWTFVHRFFLSIVNANRLIH